MIELLDKFVQYILQLLDTEVMYLKPIDILLMAAFMVGTYFFVKVLVKAFFTYGKQGVGIVSKPIRGLYIKTRARQRNKIICNVCRNPLHTCTCVKNKGASYKQRKKQWKKKQKANKSLNKPVKLSRKPSSGRKRGK